MLVGELNGVSQGQQLNILELKVFGRFVFSFPWIELGDDAVSDVTVVVDDENISYAYVLVVQEGLTEVPDDFVEILITLEALESESDSGHDGLFLLDNHAGVGADGAEVEVILDTEGKAQHQRQQKQESGTKALYLRGNFHRKLRLPNRHQTLFGLLHGGPPQLAWINLVKQYVDLATVSGTG